LEVQLIPGTESKLVTGKSTHDDSGSGCGSECGSRYGSSCGSARGSASGPECGSESHVPQATGHAVSAETPSALAYWLNAHSVGIMALQLYGMSVYPSWSYALLLTWLDRHVMSS
jgi:hypothetical protein